MVFLREEKLPSTLCPPYKATCPHLLGRCVHLLDACLGQGGEEGEAPGEDASG